MNVWILKSEKLCGGAVFTRIVVCLSFDPAAPKEISPRAHGDTHGRMCTATLSVESRAHHHDGHLGRLTTLWVLHQGDQP